MRIPIAILTILLSTEANANGTNNVEYMEQNPTFPQIHKSSHQPYDQQCGNVSDLSSRIDCHPDSPGSQEKCLERGCCWIPVPRGLKQVIGVPFCFFPPGYIGYNMSHLETMPYGYSGKLTLDKPSAWPDDVKELKIEVYMQTKLLHFKIFDNNDERYQVPLETPPVPKERDTQLDYKITFNNSPFGIKVTRKTTGSTIFDSTIGPLLFADQFIQISTRLANPYVYGLGEHTARFRVNATGWSQKAYWAYDRMPQPDVSQYGVHPFFMNFEENNQAHGVFFLNSNAMETILQPMPAITFRTIGGIIDFYLFLGPSPDDVVIQYMNIIGLPQLPPYWGLGFHLCRYGYRNISMISEVVKRNRALGIFYEAQWHDIDYAQDEKDWTYDPKRFPGLPKLVEDIHNHTQKYLILIDCGISANSPGEYPAYDDGMKMDLFVKNATGQVLLGKVWPGKTAFVDFTNPKSQDYWYQQANSFHKTIPYDGFWVDMDEPSNFVDGSYQGCVPKESKDGNLDHPPYLPDIKAQFLYSRTICPSARQYLGRHYDLHSLYGHFESKVTMLALDKIRKERSVAITRSSFAGTGKWVGHWTGDVPSSWDGLRTSLTTLLSMQMFGIPFVGAVVCGFGGDTTEELCIRWTQLGAYYPFMINHNDMGSKDQDPAVFSDHAIGYMAVALERRHMFLPYLYSMLYDTHLRGKVWAMRPLAFQYPNDIYAHTIDEQFLWGSSFLVSPVLRQGQTTLRSYFPKDTWYDFESKEVFNSPGEWRTIKAPIEKSPLHIRGGSIVPFIQIGDATTTQQSRKNPFGIIAALDEFGNARADVPLYWDDGVGLDNFAKNNVTWMWIFLTEDVLTTMVFPGYQPNDELKLNLIEVWGVKKNVTSVFVNTTSVPFLYCNEILYIDNLEIRGVSLLDQLTVSWL